MARTGRLSKSNWDDEDGGNFSLGDLGQNVPDGLGQQGQGDAPGADIQGQGDLAVDLHD
jgi:hypothetical protein